MTRQRRPSRARRWSRTTVLLPALLLLSACGDGGDGGGSAADADEDRDRVVEVARQAVPPMAESLGGEPVNAAGIWSACSLGAEHRYTVTAGMVGDDRDPAAQAEALATALADSGFSTRTERDPLRVVATSDGVTVAVQHGGEMPDGGGQGWNLTARSACAGYAEADRERLDGATSEDLTDRLR